MNYDVFVDDIESIKIGRDKKQIINTINPHSYVTAKEDKDFHEALHDSDTLLPDGSGIVLAAKQIRKENIQKIAGSDLHIYLLEELIKVEVQFFIWGHRKILLIKSMSVSLKSTLVLK